MSRLIPLILIALCLYFVFRSRRKADAIIATFTDDGQSEAPVAGQSRRSAELGLLPAEAQNTEYAAPLPDEAARALAAAERGAWEPAAELLARTVKDADWERRFQYVRLLGGRTGDDAWLRAWLEARPEDRDALLVRAAAGSDREAAQAAAAQAPKDPTPYVVQIFAALGQGLDGDEVERLWEEATSRAPRLFAAYQGALEYWCKAPAGSEELAERFAARAAVDAPLGSLMTAFPLMAWLFVHGDRDRVTEDYRTAELTRMVDAGLMDAAAAPQDHPRLPELRHLLAYFLYKQGRYDAALEQFRLVDGHVGAVPWMLYADRGLYMAAREATVRQAA